MERKVCLFDCIFNLALCRVKEINLSLFMFEIPLGACSGFFLIVIDIM